MNALGRFQLGKRLFGVLAAAFVCSSAWAQEGTDGPLTVTAANTVLNQYATLGANANAGSNSFSVTNIADLTSASYGALAAGDLVMLYQAQGATISGADTAAFGAVTDLGNAGRYEIVTVGSVSGNIVTLDASCGGLDFSYVTSGNAQVVRIPQFSSLTVNAGASVVGSAWDGVRGGVVAVQAQSLVLNGTGTVSASGLGFRGGAVDNLSAASTVDTTLYRSTIGEGGGEKGESIAGYGAAYDLLGGRYGRGAPANGGGGGNAHNAGGGGGANGNNGNAWSGQGVMSGTVTGAAAWNLDPGYVANGNARTNSSGGGRGGYTFSNSNQDALTLAPGSAAWGGNQRRERGGLGGRPLDNDPAGRLFLGGGGGAGDANNNLGVAGGRGGGLVFIIAGSVSGSGTVTADGANGNSVATGFNDAPSGGGGGGTVVVRAASLAGVGIQANGGAGGSQPITSAEAEGPGGGGGGGFIATSGGTVTRTATGGANGTTTSSALTEFPPNGATGGAAGATAASAASASVCTIPVGTVTGTIFSDANRDGAQGGGENAFTAAAVTVTLTNTTTGQAYTTTTTTGSYTFANNVSPGTYTVTASAPGYSVTTAARSVTVTSGTSTTVGVIGLATTLTPTACTVTYGGGLGSTPTASPGTAPFNVYPINPANGNAGTTLFAAPYQIVAMARHPTLNRLYYIQNVAGTTDPLVGYYDFVSGAQVPVGTIDKGTDSGNFTRFGFNALGVGYASISANNAVYQIDVTGVDTINASRSGTISAALPTGLSGDFAITAANAAWLSADGNVYRIDLGTLVAVEIINTGNATVNGVAFDANGDLLLSDTTTVYRVNLGTLAFSTVGPIGSAALSADLANCFVPTLTPNLTVAKTVTGSATPGSVLTYSITLSNSGNAVSTSTALTDLIPANTSYVVGTTTLNGTAVADDADGGDTDTLADMPFVNGSPVNSPVNGPTTYSSGTLAVGSAGAATVTFQVRVNNPLPSSVTQISNQGTVTYAPSISVQTDGDPGVAGAQATVSAVTGRDFGDAPDTASGTATGNYQTLGSDNGPSHTIVTGLRLGTVTTDADDGTLQNPAATADDGGGTDDEDGVANFPYIGTAPGQTLTVPVSVTNTTGAAATLAGFIDFNKNGVFGDVAAEVATVTVVAGATSVNLSFTTPTGLTAGATYARFRISSTAAEVTAAFGAASSGEVEDYLVSIGAPDLSVAKTSSSFVRGTTGTYTITVTNGGDLATNAVVSVTDVLPVGLTFVSATGTDWTCSYNTTNRTVTCTRPAVSAIAAGTSAPPITLTVSVDQSASGTIRNTANVSGGGEVNTTNNAGFVDTPFTSQADLALSKTGTASATVGGTVSYTLTVTNTGPSNVTGATITDPVPSALTGVSWTCAATGTASCGAASGSGNAISLTGNLNAGAGNSLTITVTGTASAPGPITNTASVAAPSGTTDPVAGNNSSSQSTTISASADLAITKTGPATATVGQSVSYILSVRNNGPSPAGGATFSDPVPSNLTGVTAVCGAASGGAAGCTVNVSGNSVTGSVATLPSGGVQVITVTGTASTAGTLRNTATVTPPTGTVDPATGNNTSSVDTAVQTAPDLTLSKTATGSFVRGGTGSYTLRVTNSGTAASSGAVTITDTLQAGLSYRSFSGSADWTCSASGQLVTCTYDGTPVIAAAGGSVSVVLSVNVAAGAPISVDNTATVSGGGEVNTGNNSSTVTTPTVDAGTLTLSKTVRNVTRLGPTGVTSSGEPGDVLEYCIGYTNSGGSTVTNTVLSDLVPANTLALLTPYAGNAVQWTVTAPTSSVQTLSASADADAGELGTSLTVRLGTISSAGAGRVCFRVTIR